MEHSHPRARWIAVTTFFGLTAVAFVSSIAAVIGAF